MQVITPYARIITGTAFGDEAIQLLELIGRVCYKSEELITPDSARRFVASRIKDGHESVIEHVSYTVHFVVDRGVSHEIVRHRLASYSQESTRYCNYAKADEIAVVQPIGLDEPARVRWANAMLNAERDYTRLISIGQRPQIARSVLPTCLKTELFMTADAREWRHFFRLRVSKAAHPQMREVTIPLLDEFKSRIPVLFDDINPS